MKTYSTTLTLALTLAFVIAVTSLASARGHGMMGHGMGALTPEKQASMQKLHEDFATTTADLRKHIFAKESELNAELFGERTDDKKVEALTSQINELRGRLYAERVNLHRKMAAEGIVPMGGRGMGAGMGCPTTGGGGMRHGMKGCPDCPMMGDGKRYGQSYSNTAPAQQ